MKASPYAGKPAEASILVSMQKLITAYYTESPDPSLPEQRVAFGTSGHRGSAFEKSFNERHILAISQAICLYRKLKKIYAESFRGADHLRRILEEAQTIVSDALAASPQQSGIPSWPRLEQK
jgi:phosphoglucomutase